MQISGVGPAQNYNSGDTPLATKLNQDITNYLGTQSGTAGPSVQNLQWIATDGLNATSGPGNNPMFHAFFGALNNAIQDGSYNNQNGNFVWGSKSPEPPVVQAVSGLLRAFQAASAPQKHGKTNIIFVEHLSDAASTLANSLKTGSEAQPAFTFIGQVLSDMKNQDPASCSVVCNAWNQFIPNPVPSDISQIAKVDAPALEKYSLNDISRDPATWNYPVG